MIGIGLCHFCKHLEPGMGSCKAFPDGIPSPVMSGLMPHFDGPEPVFVEKPGLSKSENSILDKMIDGFAKMGLKRKVDEFADADLYTKPFTINFGERYVKQGDTVPEGYHFDHEGTRHGKVYTNEGGTSTKEKPAGDGGKSQGGLSFVDEKAANDVWGRLFPGHKIDHGTAAAMVGVGADFHVEIGNMGTKVIRIRSWWPPDADGGRWKSKVYVVRDFEVKDGALTCDNEYFEVKPEMQGKGTAKAMLARQVETCQKMGVKRIKCMANRNDEASPKHVGYMVWPKFGYDAEFTGGERSKLPGLFSKFKIKTVQQLMATDWGQKWWAKNGWSKDMVLDLDPKSLSMKIFREYMAKPSSPKKFSEDGPMNEPHFDASDMEVIDGIWDKIIAANRPRIQAIVATLSPEEKAEYDALIAEYGKDAQKKDFGRRIGEKSDFSERGLVVCFGEGGPPKGASEHGFWICFNDVAYGKTAQKHLAAKTGGWMPFETRKRTIGAYKVGTAANVRQQAKASPTRPTKAAPVPKAPKADKTAVKRSGLPKMKTGAARPPGADKSPPREEPQAKPEAQKPAEKPPEAPYNEREAVAEEIRQKAHADFKQQHPGKFNPFNKAAMAGDTPLAKAFKGHVDAAVKERRDKVFEELRLDGDKKFKAEHPNQPSPFEDVEGCRASKKFNAHVDAVIQARGEQQRKAKPEAEAKPESEPEAKPEPAEPKQEGLRSEADSKRMRDIHDKLRAKPAPKELRPDQFLIHKTGGKYAIKTPEGKTVTVKDKRHVERYVRLKISASKDVVHEHKMGLAEAREKNINAARLKAVVHANAIKDRGVKGHELAKADQKVKVLERAHDKSKKDIDDLYDVYDARHMDNFYKDDFLGRSIGAVAEGVDAVKAGGEKVFNALPKPVQKGVSALKAMAGGVIGKAGLAYNTITNNLNPGIKKAAMQMARDQGLSEREAYESLSWAHKIDHVLGIGDGILGGVIGGAIGGTVGHYLPGVGAKKGAAYGAALPIGSLGSLAWIAWNGLRHPKSAFVSAKEGLQKFGYFANNNTTFARQFAAGKLDVHFAEKKKGIPDSEKQAAAEAIGKRLKAYGDRREVFMAALMMVYGDTRDWKLAINAADKVMTTDRRSPKVDVAPPKDESVQPPPASDAFKQRADSFSEGMQIRFGGGTTMFSERAVNFLAAIRGL